MSTEGKFTLAEAAGGGLSFPVDRNAEGRTLPFSYVSDAKQGPDTWYLMRLDVSVAFAPDANSGSVLVSGIAGGQVGAQIEFYPERAKGGRLSVGWESSDLIDGETSGSERGNEARAHYVGYLPITGVRPGSANLIFQVERFDGAEVSEVRIAPSSGLYATKTAPVELKLAADVPDEEVLTTGKPARLEVKVTNLSTRPAEDVVVSLSPLAPDMFIDGTATHTIESLRGTASTEFTVGLSRPGALRIEASATARNEAASSVLFKASVDSGGGGEKGFDPWIAIAAATAIAVGTTALIRRRKQRGGNS